MNVEKPSFGAYMAQLSQVSGVQITDFASLKEALRKRMAFFASMGCCVSDHALEYVMYVPAADSEVDAILAKGLKGEAVTKEMCIRDSFYPDHGRNFSFLFEKADEVMYHAKRRCKNRYYIYKEDAPET